MCRLKAIFPGSFDPPTLGHLELIKRGILLFDSIIVAVLHNPSKTALFTPEERALMLQAEVLNIPGVQVETYSGLLAEFAKKREVGYILRGIRTDADCTYEIAMAQANRKLGADNLETVLLVTNPDYGYVSASLIRQIATAGYADENFDDKILDQWVSPAIKNMLRNKLR